MPIGYILAGGRSSRMGTDKAMLTLHGEKDGETFLSHAVRTLRTIADQVVLVGDRQHLEGADRAIPDLHPNCGPLGGIEAALRDASSNHQDWACFLPVDMPLSPPTLYAALIQHWLALAPSGLRIGMVQVDDSPQPLVSVIHISTLPYIADALSRGRHKVTPVLQEAAESFSPLTSPAVGSGSNALEMILFATASPASEPLLGTSNHYVNWKPSPQEESNRHLWFQNLNTPEDLRAARDFYAQPGSTKGPDVVSG